MTREADLIKLEGVVTNLMERYNLLKSQNGELLAQIKSKDETIASLNEEIEGLRLEKTDVHGRVSSILGSIEEWERSLDDSEGDPEIVPPPVESVEETVPNSKLF